MTQIVLDSISKIYGAGEGQVNALMDVSLSIKKGEMLAIMGRSGSGKSTLLNILGGLCKMTQGSYQFEGEQLNFSKQSKLSTFRRNNIGFIVQHYALLDEYTIFENVALPLKYGKISKKEISFKVNTLLKEFQIEEKKDRYPYELSGGQCQRAAIARAIVNDAEVILADEPTGALDLKTEASIMQRFYTLNEKGKTIVIVTHDENIAKNCHRVIYIEDGKIM